MLLDLILALFHGLKLIFKSLWLCITFLYYFFTWKPIGYNWADKVRGLRLQNQSPY